MTGETTPALPLIVAARLLRTDLRGLRALISAGTLPVYRRRGREVMLSEDVVGVAADMHRVPVECVYARSEIFSEPTDLNLHMPDGKWFAAVQGNLSRERFTDLLTENGWTEVPKVLLGSCGPDRLQAALSLRDNQGRLPDKIAAFDFSKAAVFLARDRKVAEKMAVLLRLDENV